ncbi:MAG: hypothetical protein PHN69_05120 [Candidatus Pacebacteria bacterium]|nr:hypothetical protein [Candidatus Paceibacterota bacterium]
MKKVTPGQVLGLATVLANNVDWSKLDGDAIQDLITDPSGTGKKGTEWLVNNANVQLIVANYTVDLDADPFLPNNWKVESHKKGGKIPFNPNMVDLYLSDEQKNGSIQGNDLRKKIEVKNPYNANLLDFYLAHPELIPESWKGQYVFFWGTIYRNADDSFFVRYLCWDGGRWDWGCRWLGRDWRSGDPSPVPGK